MLFLADFDEMRQELELAQESLFLVARRSKNRLDTKIRVVVRDLLEHRYSVELTPKEVEEGSEELFRGVEIIERLSDRIFGVDNTSLISKRRSLYKWNKERPRRVLDYVQKIVYIFPADHLTRLLRSSQHMTAAELIGYYEAVKGEAIRGDYTGIPSGIDPNSLRSIGKVLHVI
jgi:hypothetical protein